jgi:hypothetical protein
VLCVWPPNNDLAIGAACPAAGVVDCCPNRFLPPPNKLPPGPAGWDVAPVLASSVVDAGGSPAGVVEPNEKPPILGAAGVVEPNIEGVAVVTEEGALVETGGFPQAKLGVPVAAMPLVVCAVDAPKPPNVDGVLPVVFLVALFPKPPKPPVAPLVPNNDGVLVPEDWAPPKGEAPPKLNLGVSDIVGDVIRSMCVSMLVGF